MIKNIGLALSGGGVRATVFHLGLLKYLAERDLFGQVKYISTVSGGSLCMGLIQSESKVWPSSDYFLEEIIPRIRSTLTTYCLQTDLIDSTFASFGLINRSNLLAKILERNWGISGNITEMYRNPRWVINGTCIETGKNWRFMHKRMGDYLAQYTIDPCFSLSKALAASASVPGVIGPLVIDSKNFSWSKYVNEDEYVKCQTPLKKYHIWDGGVYENLGLEALFDGFKIKRKEVDFLIVSDASAPLNIVEKKFFSFLGNSIRRLVDITTDQERALRSRALINFFKSEFSKNGKCTGVLVKIGNTVDYINSHSRKNVKFSSKVFDKKTVTTLYNLPTTLKKLTEEEFNSLIKHGWETAKATIEGYT